jgi:hypothetical protein
MSDNAQQYPLSWPTGWKRTAYGLRRPAPFSKQVSRPGDNGSVYKSKERLSVGDAMSRLVGELRRLSAQRAVISSNLRVREDGLPYANQAKQLDDPGVAVYFRLNGQPRVLACDRWSSVADNMAAIAGHIEAIRACERYGVGSLDQAFTGYAALPANTAAQWRDVFGFTSDQRVTWPEVENAFRTAARAAHPDAGGTHEQMARLTEAKGFAKKELLANFQKVANE